MRHASTRRNSLPSMIALALLAAGAAQTATAQKTITLDQLGTYASGIYLSGSAEIGAFDPETERIFVTNATDVTLDVIDASDPENPVLAFQIDLTQYGGVANSVAVDHGLVAVAMEAFVKTDAGAVLFFDTDGDFITQVGVGAQPDMLTFTHDGRYLLVANEGEPADDYAADPAGSVSIVDMSGAIGDLSDDDVRTVSFTAYDSAQLPASVRVFGPTANPVPSENFEPEYIAVSANGRTAFVTLQENNALAVIDIRTGTITGLYGLGFKDHNIAGNGIDASDRDNAITIATWPVYGMYQPDAIASYGYRGDDYLVMANEGDSRDWDGYGEEARVSAVTLDPTAFPNRATLRTNANLGRLTITTATGDTDGDGDFDALYAFGARSFSIRAADGTLVYDSGDDLEQMIALLHPADFNANSETNVSFDNRSDNKGPEPEGLTIGNVNGRTYLFLGLERIGGIMVYDITVPTAPTFVEYVNNRDFSGDAAQGTAGDLGPEGLHFVERGESPSGAPLVIVTNEISGTTTIYEVGTINGGAKSALAVAAGSTELGLAAPNPTSTSTAIAFTLDADRAVRLEVVDSHGSIVKIVVDEFYAQGTHSTDVDLSELPVGTYFTRLLVDGGVVGMRAVSVVR